MENQQILFQGTARIYLQGKNALYPFEIINCSNAMHYYIGQESTEFIVHDYRKEPVITAKNVLKTQYQNGFAGIFNQPAWVEIRYDQPVKKVEIELHDTQENISSSLLWLGILEDNIMPSYKVEWEVFKPLDTGKTAFVSLIR